ncbi:MAG: cadherin-like beta sandwich domain-containing protein, partial [Lachnospiraceae bacterium]|nr:cadherin-like beta sandwich domain-containing protein [Lachnospiraceae bacterium]
STLSSYTVSYLVPAAPPAEPEDPDDDDDEPDDVEPTKPDPSTAFDGANAVGRDAAGLAVRISAKNSSEMLYTPDGKAVLLYTGDPVQIIDVSIDNGKIWCYIRFYFNGFEFFGYIRSTHLESDVLINLLSTQTEASSAPLDFETKLEREGFPESYKPMLRDLHAQYPLWEFKAYHTGIDWNEAVAAESQVGVSLLPNYYSLEWLSFEEGAYSWKTDKFTIFDGTYWVAASEDAVRYYMDPRNFLTYTGIFMFENLTYNPSIQTGEGAADILKTTAFGNGATYKYKDDFGVSRVTSYVDTFLMAAEYSGVSLYHLVSRSKNEIGNGTPSNSVSGTVSGYEGLYNFYNVGANDSAIPGQNIRNGLEFAKKGRGSAAMNQLYLIPWSNPFRAILGGAFYLGYNYVNKGQDTLYFERFNVVSDGAYPVFTHQYMTNVAAACTESTSTSRGYDNAAEMAIEFTIPVYLNMPEEICIAPEKALNPNNWLKSLKITDQNGNELPLTPTFDSSVKQSYSIIVDHEVSSAIVDAVTVSKLAEITSGSRFDLDVGENLITVKVKAENGKVRKYKIYISREPDPNAAPEDNTGDAETGENTGDAENTGETDNTGDPENTQIPEGTDNAGEGDANIPEDGTGTTDEGSAENGGEPESGNGIEAGGEPEGGTGEPAGEGYPEGGGE